MEAEEKEEETLTKPGLMTSRPEDKSLICEYFSPIPDKNYLFCHVKTHRAFVMLSEVLYLYTVAIIFSGCFSDA